MLPDPLLPWEGHLAQGYKAPHILLHFLVTLTLPRDFELGPCFLDSFLPFELVSEDRNIGPQLATRNTVPDPPVESTYECWGHPDLRVGDFSPPQYGGPIKGKQTITSGTCSRDPKQVIQ